MLVRLALPTGTPRALRSPGEGGACGQPRTRWSVSLIGHGVSNMASGFTPWARRSPSPSETINRS